MSRRWHAVREAEFPWPSLLVLAVTFVVYVVISTFITNDSSVSIEAATDTTAIGSPAVVPAPLVAGELVASPVTTAATGGLAAVVTATADRGPAFPAVVRVTGATVPPRPPDPCADVDVFRRLFDLPDRFVGLAFRESSCDNSATTWCCYGWFQLYVELHLADHRLAPLYAECGITGPADVLGDTPAAKRRNVCGAAAVYQIQGGSAWDAW